MPAINIEDLSEKDKLKMEVEQLRKEVKLERQPVSGRGEGARSCPGLGVEPGASPFRRARQGRRGCGSRSSAEPRLFWDGRGLHRRSCHHFGLGAGDGALGTAPLTPRRGAGPCRGWLWSPGEGAHHPWDKAPREAGTGRPGAAGFGTL